MSRHFVVVAGITILSATTPVSASAQICDGALSWLCQALASSNREMPQMKSNRTTGLQRSHRPVSLAGRRLSPQHSDPRGLSSSEHPQRRAGLKPEEREALFQQFLEWRKNPSVDNP
jgi:hypothetical protein